MSFSWAMVEPVTSVGGIGELGAARLDALVVALDVVGEEHDRGLALLEHGLLVGLGRRVVVERELQLGPVGLFRRGHGQPAIRPVAEIGLLGKAQHVGVEAQRLFLVVHIDAGQLDLHRLTPFLDARMRVRPCKQGFALNCAGGRQSIRARTCSRARKELRPPDLGAPVVRLLIRPEARLLHAQMGPGARRGERPRDDALEILGVPGVGQRLVRLDGLDLAHRQRPSSR